MNRQNERRHSNHSMPELYSIFLGEVASVQQYGAFVRIPGLKKQGLVHKSQISSVRVEEPSDVLQVGEQVYCKVINIQEDGQKIGLSMKVVNQSTGKDLDPNQVQTALDEQKRKEGHKRETPRIELGAVLDTTCTKCGGKGHLAQDCFHTPGGQSYELLPDLEEMWAQTAEQDPAAKKHKKAKKEKKKIKKEKKKKKHIERRDEDSNSDSSCDHTAPKKKKRKKSKPNSSDDESSSDSDTGAKRQSPTSKDGTVDSRHQRRVSPIRRSNRDRSRSPSYKSSRNRHRESPTKTSHHHHHERSPVEAGIRDHRGSDFRSLDRGSDFRSLDRQSRSNRERIHSSRDQKEDQRDHRSSRGSSDIHHGHPENRDHGRHRTHSSSKGDSGQEVRSKKGNYGHEERKTRDLDRHSRTPVESKKLSFTKSSSESD